MKVLIDIGHPAHVHYFRNLIKILEARGHSILITTRDKEITLKLLDRYGLPYKCTSKNRSSLLGKMIALVKNDLSILREALRFKPDLLISAFLPFAAHVGALIKKPVIGLTDTEHASLNILLAKPFTDAILVPISYRKDLGKKQIRFNGNLELTYLHPNYFTPDLGILDHLGVREGDKYVIMRFVSWHASHDRGYRGLSLAGKIKAVNELSKHARVFICSEEPLPQELEDYRLTIPIDAIHHVLHYAALYFGDGGTMASECSVLGTPSINVATSALEIGTFRELENSGLMYVMPDEEAAIHKGLELLSDPSLKEDCQRKRDDFLSQKIDVTQFLVSFIENYPASVVASQNLVSSVNVVVERTKCLKTY